LPIKQLATSFQPPTTRKLSGKQIVTMKRFKTLSSKFKPSKQAQTIAKLLFTNAATTALFKNEDNGEFDIPEGDTPEANAARGVVSQAETARSG
jgi:hypothetical protein